MFPQSNHSPIPLLRTNILRVGNAFVLLLLVGAFPSARAQTSFSSGSTGADGAFAPASNQTVAVPSSGVFNFTTVNVPAGVTVTFTRNAQNTPVTILASGNITIAGSLVLSGQAGATSGAGGIGGSGGFDGGMGGFGLPNYSGNPGQGPGAGTSGKKSSTTNGSGGGGGGFNIAGLNGGGEAGSFGLGGPKYGSNTLLPLSGGSGGGGGGASTSARGASGGGGGGAILLASSGTITFSGTPTINAQGGAGGSASASGANFGGGGGGSGGAIRLIANTISGAATLNVNGGASGGCWSGGCGGSGGLGYVRVEAYDLSGFTATGGSPNNLSFAVPNPVALTTVPQLRVASVAGVNAPTTPLGSFQGVPDVLVPASQANPVTVALEAANIPLGTVIQVTLIPSFGARTTVSSSALAGTEAASTATASLTLPSGMSVISATAVCDLSLASVRPIFIDGERVHSFEVAAVFGGRSKVTYITASGRRIRKPD
jgi:hypothetical protein